MLNLYPGLSFAQNKTNVANSAFNVNGNSNTDYSEDNAIDMLHAATKAKNRKIATIVGWILLFAALFFVRFFYKRYLKTKIQ